MKKRRALISVFDKTGVVDFAKQLENLNFEIVSTGGTYKLLKENNISVVSVSDITGFIECLDGRVKTLHPSVHAGILANRSINNHMSSLKELNISPIDIVAVNLYPFKQTIQKQDVTLEMAIENIDIGGPTMLRSAAKNYNDVNVIVEPSDYQVVIDEIKKNNNTSYETRFMLMKKVFEHTSAYDSLIFTYFNSLDKKTTNFNDNITLTYEKCEDMRYGENPHQKAAYYKTSMPNTFGLHNAEQLHGKKLSFNNINDTNAAIELLKDLGTKVPTVVAVKHTNPCGVAYDKELSIAFKKAYECDPQSIFGGIIAINKVVDFKTAELISKIFIEVVVAPDFTPEALDILSQKENIRLLKLNIENEIKNSLTYKNVLGGLLVQERDISLKNEIKSAKLVTDKGLKPSWEKDLEFAMKVVKHVKSNAVVLVKKGATIGIGVGQVSRVWALEQAIDHAKTTSSQTTVGSVMASDAFFPFDDCIELARKAKIRAIAQPGGSKNDQASIDACNKNGIAMVFSGVRHFKH